MLRETLTALRSLGLLRLCLPLALVLGLDILLSYLEITVPAIGIVLSVMIGHMVTRATALDQPLFRRDGKGSFPHMGRYLLANLWVYGLVLLAMICGMIASGALWTHTGLGLVIKGIVGLNLGAILLLLGMLAIVGTALPAAAMGAPYGMPTALATTQGQRWRLFGALLLVPGGLSVAQLLLAGIGGQADAVSGFLGEVSWEGVDMVEGGVLGEIVSIAGKVLSFLSVIFTSILLTLAWRRRHRPAALAEVFQ
ncbi:MAG TPA: hypothetical protein PLH11_12535 [Gemmobacter sp.]|nr:hypothetical protein [Gemmobacter sp.]